MTVMCKALESLTVNCLHPGWKRISGLARMHVSRCGLFRNGYRTEACGARWFCVATFLVLMIGLFAMVFYVPDAWKMTE